MSKRTTFTTITPLPNGVDRETVLHTLHNHLEMIDLNPLVIDRFRCPAPSYATTEQLSATWYQLKDKVEYLPGGLASGDVTYHSCFHDLPTGLQTHVYAPLGLEIRGKWTLGGNLPGEAPERAELGLKVPAEGLYLREDTDMRCNFMMTPFVKKTLRKAHARLVDTMLEKAKVRATNAHILGLDRQKQYSNTSVDGARDGPNRSNTNDSALSGTSLSSETNAYHTGSAMPLPRYYAQDRRHGDEPAGPQQVGRQQSMGGEAHDRATSQAATDSRTPQTPVSVVSPVVAPISNNSPVELPAHPVEAVEMPV